MEDPVSDLSVDDLNFLKCADTKMAQWTENLRAAMNCKSLKDMTKNKLMSQNKETLAAFLLDGYQTVQSNTAKYEAARLGLEKIKSELIVAQRSVVKLQQQLLEEQAKQLNEMSTVVDTAVDRGIQSYSQVVSQTIEKSVPVLTEQTLKKVVQEAVTDDDRSKNVVVFGLAEETSEDLHNKVTALFNDVDEKPNFEAVRIGEISEGKSRPVKISLRNSETVRQILLKAKNLRNSKVHRKVYVTPDRSPEERVKHRKLVEEMKQKASENPDMHYYIYSGQIYYKDRD